MAKIVFGNVEEDVVTREEFPLEKAREVLKSETIAVLGYGVQGPAQSLNMRDNGVKVIIGQEPSDKTYWDKAIRDGWEPGKTLFSLEEAAEQSHHHPVPGFRCRSNDDLAQNQDSLEKR